MRADDCHDISLLYSKVEICDQPVLIAAANRYSNTTIRLFRNSDYWDLMSLPDRQAFVSKRMKLWPPLAPVTMKTSILTVLSGPMKDMTYKFSKNVFWSWNDTIGQQVSGGKGGELWMDLPPDASDGFDTMFHNDNESDPMIIAFKGDKVCHVLDTDSNCLRRSGICRLVKRVSNSLAMKRATKAKAGPTRIGRRG